MEIILVLLWNTLQLFKMCQVSFLKNTSWNENIENYTCTDFGKKKEVSLGYLKSDSSGLFLSAFKVL